MEREHLPDELSMVGNGCLQPHHSRLGNLRAKLVHGLFFAIHKPAAANFTNRFPWPKTSCGCLQCRRSNAFCLERRYWLAKGRGDRLACDRFAREGNWRWPQRWPPGLEFPDCGGSPRWHFRNLFLIGRSVAAMLQPSQNRWLINYYAALAAVICRD